MIYWSSKIYNIPNTTISWMAGFEEIKKHLIKLTSLRNDNLDEDILYIEETVNDTVLAEFLVSFWSNYYNESPLWKFLSILRERNITFRYDDVVYSIGYDASLARHKITMYEKVENCLDELIKVKDQTNWKSHMLDYIEKEKRHV